MRKFLLPLPVLIAALLLQGCTVVRIATAPLRFTARQIGKARAEKRGEKRGERRAEERAAQEAAMREAPPAHIDRPDLPPPADPAN